MCHSRSCHPTMTILQAPTPAPSTNPGPRRGSGPEIFTFDPLPEPAAAPAGRPSASRGHRKRSRRVLYPRVVSIAEVGIRGVRCPGVTGERPDSRGLDLTCLLFCLPLGPAPAASRGTEPSQKASLSAAHHRLLPDPDG
ncbi:IER3 isoform 1 [Pan troglodytes]|uniref:IER3 isoform 1 n=1 Tax=Pan troglodytes TaxID=9598 RepID=A0A2J8NXA8_PANTR|nr:IER3 isoform 1 [Pan troglodytes]